MSEGLNGTRGRRLLSHTEIGKAMTCQAQWDFAYGGHLAGDALKPKRTAPRLQGGRAWGAAVAAYHADSGQMAGEAAVASLDKSLDDDAQRMKDFGFYDEEAHRELRVHLLGMLTHYIMTCDDFKLDPILERRVMAPIPSRTGKRVSSRYSFLGYLDGTKEVDGRTWVVEFKLRDTLTSVEFIQLDRQIRRYAWAWWRMTGIKPAGVEVHERLNSAPKQPRMVKSRKKVDGEYPLVPSHARDQLCTADAYKSVCEEHDVDITPETYEALKARQWQNMVPIMFRDGELEEAGQELVTAGKLIRDLDNGELFPVRNSKPQNCRGCSFREICPTPDSALVDMNYERRVPKRHRSEEEQRATDAVRS